MTTAKRLLATGALLLVSLSAAVVYAGGWTVITLQNVPTHLRPGHWTTLVYTVRQHGHSPMNGLSGRLEARQGETLLRSQAHRLPPEGSYDVNVKFPTPGTWTVDLIAGSGLVGDTLTLTVDVVEEGLAPPAVSEVGRGKQLFAGKGCVMCHRHPEFSDRPSANLLDMSAKRYTDAYVQSFLLSVPPRPVDPDGPRRMPNLGLARHEVESLAAFLSR